MGVAFEGDKNQLLMGNTLLPAAQTALSFCGGAGWQASRRQGTVQKTGGSATPLFSATRRLTETLVRDWGGALKNVQNRKPEKANYKILNGRK